MCLRGKEGGTDRLWDDTFQPTSTPQPTAQLLPQNLLFSGHWREPGLFRKVLYTNKAPFIQPIYLHGVTATPKQRNGQWEEMDRAEGWNVPHVTPAYPEAQGHRPEP